MSGWAWETLERLYEDPLFTSLAVKRNLMKFMLDKGEIRSQIEGIARVIKGVSGEGVRLQQTLQCCRR